MSGLEKRVMDCVNVGRQGDRSLTNNLETQKIIYIKGLLNITSTPLVMAQNTLYWIVAGAVAGAVTLPGVIALIGFSTGGVVAGRSWQYCLFLVASADLLKPT